MGHLSFPAGPRSVWPGRHQAAGWKLYVCLGTVCFEKNRRAVGSFTGEMMCGGQSTVQRRQGYIISIFQNHLPISYENVDVEFPQVSR